MVQIAYSHVYDLRKEMTMKLDTVDRKILEVLQEDGRMANKEIAYRVGLVPSATSERLKKLRERGIIKSFEARLDSAKVGRALLAFVFVRTNEKAGHWHTAERLTEIPDVLEVYNVAGEDCYLIKVRTKDTHSLSKLLREKIGVIDEVISTRTTIVMETYKESCRIPLDNSD
jgi:Lrp/AsnC family leucine-responsive transcriptional regulator